MCTLCVPFLYLSRKYKTMANAFKKYVGFEGGSAGFSLRGLCVPHINSG